MAPLADQSWRAVPVPWHRRWGKRLTILILLAAAAALAGLLYEPLAEGYQLRESPPPGRVVQANGLDLHMQVAGPPSSPAVVLLGGWGLPSASWGWIYPQVSRTNLVLRWDPPGYAWSGFQDDALDAAAQVERLRTAMRTYEVNGPYLLVGTGSGALMARVFMARYPDEVAGLVLIDPWHQPLMGDAAGRAADLDREAFHRRFAWHRLKAWWLKDHGPDLGLPDRDEKAMAASFRTVKLARAQAGELRALPQSFEEAQGNQSFGQRPLVVLTSGGLDPGGWDGPWAAGAQAQRIQMDEQLSKLSTQGRHAVVPGATPVTLLCHQEFADQVVQAIRTCTGH